MRSTSPPSSRLFCCLAAFALGAACVMGVAAGHRRGRAEGEDPAAFASRLHRRDETEGSRAGDLAKLSPRELRRLLSESDEMELSRTGRFELRDTLLEAWEKTDPEGALLWEQAQLWDQNARWPGKLAAEHPDFVYRLAKETGNEGLLTLVERANPAAALALLKEDGLLTPMRLMTLVPGGVGGDPDFLRQLDELDDPALKMAAWKAADSFYFQGGQTARMGDLWRAHPEMVDAESLGEIAFKVGRGDGFSWGDLLPGEDWENAVYEPVSELKFLKRLQTVYQQDGTEEDFQKILTEFGIAGKSPEAIASAVAIAEGRGTREDVEAYARSWVQAGRDDDLGDPDEIFDPIFRNAALREMLEGDHIPPSSERTPEEQRQRMILQITDPALRQEMEDKFPKREQ